MTFLAPGLLAVGVLLALPLLLHLFRRREPPPISFPALRYLQGTSLQPDGLVRLRHRLLLLVRTLLLAGLVLAAARWVVPLPGGDALPAALILLVDNGLHSAITVEGESRLSAHVTRAQALLDGAAPRDQIWVLPLGMPWEPIFPLTPEGARTRLGTLQSTEVRPDLSQALARADALLSARSEHLRRRVVVGDLQGMLIGEEVDTPVTILSALEPFPEQRGVGQVERVGEGPPREGEGVELRVTLSGSPKVGTPVRAFVDGGLAAVSQSDPEGEALLQLPPLPLGWVTGWVEVDPDALRADDVRAFAFSVAPVPSVVVVGDPSPFLGEALEVLSEAGRIRSPAPGSAPSVLIVAGRWAHESTPARLVIFPPEDPALLPALNRELERMAIPWRFGGTPEFGTRRLEAVNPAFRWLDGIRVEQSYPLLLTDPARGGAPLVRMGAGELWAVTSALNGGEVTFLASPLSAQASELPTSAAMIPFIDRLMTPPGSQGTHTRATGHPLPVPFGAESLSLPDGTTRRVSGTSSVLDTGQAGIYRFHSAEGEVLAIFALAPAPPPRVADEGPGRWSGAQWVENPALAWEEVRRGREVWGILLLAALFLLLLESWLAATPGGARRPVESHSNSRFIPR